MTDDYQVTGGVRLANQLTVVLVRLGIAPKRYALLSIIGRKSGKMYTIPVILVEEDQLRWLVSPYGEVNWVRNARSAGQVVLSRGWRSEKVNVVELSLAERAPILKKYTQIEPFTRSYFNAQPDSPVEAFAAESRAIRFSWFSRTRDENITIC